MTREPWCPPPSPRLAVGPPNLSADLPDDVHPFFVGTQAHPELKSRPTRPHPLFSAFVKAVVDRKVSERLPVELPEASVAAR